MYRSWQSRLPIAPLVDGVTLGHRYLTLLAMRFSTTRLSERGRKCCLGRQSAKWSCKTPPPQEVETSVTVRLLAELELSDRQARSEGLREAFQARVERGCRQVHQIQLLQRRSADGARELDLDKP